jgi:hypothetical protein
MNFVNKQDILEEPGLTDWLKEQWFLKSKFPIMTVSIMDVKCGDCNAEEMLSD